MRYTVYITIIICLLSVLIYSLRNNDKNDLLIPDYSDYYYYNNISEKMIESMSINYCTLYGADLTKQQGGTAIISQADLILTIKPPNKQVYDKWVNSYLGTFRNKLFTKATEHLCNIQHYKEFKRGDFKRGRGCYKKYAVVNNQVVQRINRYGGTFHPDHIRCDIVNATTACSNFGKDKKTGFILIPNSFRLIHQFPFIIQAKHVLIARSGMLALNCGVFGLFSQCEAVSHGVPSANSVIGNISICQNNDNNCTFPKYNKVFILTQYDDTQIGQFLMESLPKLIHNLDYIKQNPDIKIHFGFTKKTVLPSHVNPHYFFEWLGLRDRLINGTVYANEIVMPREGGCQDPGYNAWEIISMREYFYNMLRTDVITNTKLKIVIVVRSSKSTFLQNKGDMDKRRWPINFISNATTLFNKLLPAHEVVVFSDLNTTLMTCPLCQVEAFYNADIVIGMHGAGMSNIMYMQSGGIVVEVVPKFDSRHAPLIGIFPRLSSIVGCHHYHYNIEGIKLDVTKFIYDIVSFYRTVTTWSNA